MVEASIRSHHEGRKVRIDEILTPELSAAPACQRADPPNSRGEMSRKRLLFVGLDAADADLIEQWSRQGALPNIARMKAQGASFRMRTTAEIFIVSAWPSIFTGTEPDQHGLHHAYVTHRATRPAAAEARSGPSRSSSCSAIAVSGR